MKRNLIICSIILIIISTVAFLNRHIFYNNKEKAIYNYIKYNQGTFIANCIRIKYQPTDKVTNPEVKSYGEWYIINGAKGFTGKFERLYFAVKLDKNKIYQVTTVKTDP